MTAAGDPRIDHYDWAGGREAMLRFGPGRGPTVVLALPLLEEANRTRALAVGMLRALASRGIAGALPELPGTGESPVGTMNLRLADLRAAFAAAAEHVAGRTYAISIRSGALFSVVTPDLIRGPAVLSPTVESGFPAQARPELRRRGRGDVGGWALSPQKGAEVVREWRRLRDAGDGVTVAGNRVEDEFLADLAGAEPSPARIVRLAGDPRPADHVLSAPPPWRRAEPDGDPTLAALLAEDIAQWIAACVG